MEGMEGRGLGEIRALFILGLAGSGIVEV